MKLLAWSMGHRWVVGLAMLLTFLSVIPLGKAVQKNFLPVDDESRFDVVIRAPEGTSLEQTRLIAERIAREVRALPGVSHTVTTTGSPPGDPSRAAAPTRPTSSSRLVPATQRADNQQGDHGPRAPRGAPALRRASTSASSSRRSTSSAAAPPTARPSSTCSRAPTSTASDYAERMLAEVRRIPGVVDADTTLVTGKPELVVRINRARAADLG
jgi:HAE1 family hydrophobic/amphiphilic exporter-1